MIAGMEISIFPAYWVNLRKVLKFNNFNIKKLIKNLYFLPNTAVAKLLSALFFIFLMTNNFFTGYSLARVAYTSGGNLASWRFNKLSFLSILNISPVFAKSKLR